MRGGYLGAQAWNSASRGFLNEGVWESCLGRTLLENLHAGYKPWVSLSYIEAFTSPTLALQHWFLITRTWVWCSPSLQILVVAWPAWLQGVSWDGVRSLEATGLALHTCAFHSHLCTWSVCQTSWWKHCHILAGASANVGAWQLLTRPLMQNRRGLGLLFDVFVNRSLPQQQQQQQQQQRH